jgi:hypothetical protein
LYDNPGRQTCLNGTRERWRHSGTREANESGTGELVRLHEILIDQRFEVSRPCKYDSRLVAPHSIDQFGWRESGKQTDARTRHQRALEHEKAIEVRKGGCAQHDV